MSYIESHEELENHPKLLDLMVALEIDKDTAIGRVHRFWYWSMKYAESGVLEKHSAARINAQFGRGFVEAMTAAGFIDKDRYRIHDWVDYAGRYLTSRYRQRRPLYVAEIYLEYGRREVADQILTHAMSYKTAARVTQEQYERLMGRPTPLGEGGKLPADPLIDRVKEASLGPVEYEQTPPKEPALPPLDHPKDPKKQPSAHTNSSHLNSTQLNAAQLIPSPPMPPDGGKGRTAKKPRSVADTQTPGGYELLAAIHPNRTNLKSGERAYARVNPSPEMAAVMLEAMKKQIAGPVWSEHIRKGSTRYIPQLATWLKDERWKDEIPTAARNNGKEPLDGPPVGEPYQPRTPLQCLVCVYKMLKGIAMEDRGWDEANWPGAEPAAAKLLAAFDGDDRAAGAWLETYSQQMAAAGYDKWTLRGAFKQAWDTKGERKPAPEPIMSSAEASA